MNKIAKIQLADLHLHTTASDGTLTPLELIQLAFQGGYETIAITDHDTLIGYEAAKDEAEKHDINLIPGVEISTKYSGGTQHILAYGFDPESPVIQEKLEKYRNARSIRNEKIARKFQEMGIDITLEMIREKAEKTDNFGRPHFAALLCDMGIVGSMQEAFDIYLKKDGKAYVPKEIFTSKEAFDFIHEAGGMAILAHPITLKLDEEPLKEYLAELKEQGLDGLEVYSSSHNQKWIARLHRLADSLGLLKTAGSDFHGMNKENVPFGVAGNGLRIKREWISNDFFMRI